MMNAVFVNLTYVEFSPSFPRYDTVYVNVIGVSSTNLNK